MKQSKQHRILENYIKGVVNGLSDNLIVIGQPGIGKTEITFNILQKFNLIEKQHYLYIQNYITPKALVEKLEEVNNLQAPKILIIDDGEDTLRNTQSIGVLKGAMWIAGNQRRVNWITTREKVEFDFTGKIIFLLNQFNKKNAPLNALKDRSLYFEMSLSPNEIKNLIIEKAKKSYHNTSYHQRMKVVNFLSQYTNNPNMSLRTYPQALNLMILSPSHWRELTLRMLTNK